MSKTTEVLTASFPFFSILTLILITLKLTGFIAWSWWWVLMFVWMPISVIILIIFVIGILYVIKEWSK